MGSAIEKIETVLEMSLSAVTYNAGLTFSGVNAVWAQMSKTEPEHHDTFRMSNCDLKKLQPPILTTAHCFAHSPSLRSTLESQATPGCEAL